MYFVGLITFFLTLTPSIVHSSRQSKGSKLDNNYFSKFSPKSSPYNEENQRIRRSITLNEIVQDIEKVGSVIKHDFVILEGDLEKIGTAIKDEFIALEGQVEETVKELTDFEFAIKRCTCVHKECGCCFHWRVALIKLDTTVCVNVAYLDTELGLRFSVAKNRQTIFSYKLSLKNPPAACFSLPFMAEFASLCAKFHSLSFNGQRLSFCFKITAWFDYAEIEHLDLGCHTMGFGGYYGGNHGIRGIYGNTESGNNKVEEKPSTVSRYFNAVKKAVLHPINFIKSWW